EREIFPVRHSMPRLALNGFLKFIGLDIVKGREFLFVRRFTGLHSTEQIVIAGRHVFSRFSGHASGQSSDRSGIVIVESGCKQAGRVGATRPS
ncbi:MAG: hypothetical protein QF609_04395, partial [Gammaproteobacteria bacterium]|nr:hypothetical protein [Gammaproteobacteria bacterium]